MQDLRLVAANESGTHLVLRSQVGEKYLLAIDERLRAAVRGDRARLGQLEIETDSQLRPRDIQARIRAGATAEQVAMSAGVPVDRVRRFEGPVLAEREHMAKMAQRGAVRRAASADNRAAPLTLGEAVASRLDPLKIKPEELGWDSWRREDGHWLVQLAYEFQDENRRARFVFDFRARTIAAEDDEARWMVGELEERPKRAPFVPRIAEAPRESASQPAMTPSAPPKGVPASIRGDHPAGRKLPDAPPRRRDQVPAAEAPSPQARPEPARRAPDVVARRPEPDVIARSAAPAAPAAPVAPPAPAARRAPAGAPTAPAAPAARPAAPAARQEAPAAAEPPARTAPAARVASPAPAAAVVEERPRRMAPLDFLVPPVPGTPDSSAGPTRRESAPRPAARRPGIRSDVLGGPRPQRRSVLDVPPAAGTTQTAVVEPEAVEQRRTGTHDARPASTGPRRRASVPSWDDIMFGTRRRD